MKEKLSFLFPSERAQVGHMPPRCLGLSIMQNYKNPLVTSPLNEWSTHRRGNYLHKIQQTQQTKLYALDEIRTRSLSNGQATYLRLRRQSHRDRRKFISFVMTSNITLDYSGNNYVFLCLRGYKKYLTFMSHRKLPFVILRLVVP